MTIHRSLAGGLAPPSKGATAGLSSSVKRCDVSTAGQASSGTQRARAPRTGVVLFTVIAVLAVGMVLLGLAMRSLVREHQQCRLRHDDRKCHRLATAGIELGRAQLNRDAQYEGEEWEIPGVELHQRKSHATVTIRVVKNEDGSQELVVTAEHWRLNQPRVRHTERTILKP